MESLTSSVPAVKRKRPERHVRLTTSGSLGLLELAIGRERFMYYLERIACDQGEAFMVQKMWSQGGDIYHVNLNGPQGHTCCCKGFCRWNHCKHIESLQALQQEGKLAALPIRQPGAIF